MRKRVVMSAALAAFGCAGADNADSGGAVVPPFSSNWSPNATGVPATNGSADAPSTADEASAQNPANSAGANGSAANSPSEGQNTALPVAPASSGNAANGNGNSGNGASSGAAAPADTATTPPAGNGMQAGADQGGYGMQGGNGMQAGNTPPAANPTPPAAPRAPLNCSAAAPALTNAKMSCAVNASGAIGDQRWFMWFSGSGGCITTYDQPAFKATWNNSGDFLARSGLQFDETKTFDQYGTIGADLSFTRTGSAGGYSFIGIYGWSNNPLIEYYIVDDSFGNGPATPYATTQKGTFTVDGASYKIYSGTKTNQPSLHGTANFQQFFSVRQTPRQCGHISISEHFKQWAGMGMTLGKMSEARVLVEAGGGSGSANFTTADVTTGGN